MSCISSLLGQQEQDSSYLILTLYMCVQYIGGCSVHWGVFSTSGGYHEYIGGDIMSTLGGYHEYIGECPVHRGDIMMNVGGYHEYIGECSVHRRNTMSTSGDIMSTSGDIMSTSGDVQYIGGIS